MKNIEAYLDIDALDKGTAFADGDVIQVLEIPANTLVLNAGAEVMSAFTSTDCTFDLGITAGDDIIDGLILHLQALVPQVLMVRPTLL